MSQRKATTKPARKGRANRTPADMPETFAHHLSEVLRIARTADFLTARFYNSLADAWCEFESQFDTHGQITESPEYIALVMRHASQEGVSADA